MHAGRELNWKWDDPRMRLQATSRFAWLPQWSFALIEVT
jgi:hypothetical protein